MKPDSIVAVTSLSPAPRRLRQQQACIASWRNAGLRVCSLNHPSEIATLKGRYDIELVRVAETAFKIFGRHFMPVSAALRWGARLECPMLLINSDIELRLTAWELKRFRWLAADGLCYFVRHNHAGDLLHSTREPFGIDVFLLHSRNSNLVPPSFLSIGQPAWDYLLPHVFAANSRPVCAVEYPVAFHCDHPRQWSWENWRRCAMEFERVAGTGGSDSSFEALVARSRAVRAAFDRKRRSIPRTPTNIHAWVEREFDNDAPKTFLELGSHCGSDTAWMAALREVVVHAFEPDPRNHQPARPNVTQHRAAISDADGRASFVLSREGWGQPWSHSSSLKQPKNHLQRYPVTFGELIEVETVALDGFCRRPALGEIDFI